MTIAAGTGSGIFRQRGFWLRCFLERAGLAAAVVIALAPGALRAQDCVDTQGGRPCSAQESKRMREAICKTEVVAPNLVIAAPAKVSGVLLDQTGAPFALGENTIVQVRAPDIGKPLYSSAVNVRGEFDLGQVKAGTFRMVVAIKVHGGVLERPPGFDQPNRADCSGEDECKIRAVLHVHGTDSGLEHCPPK